VVGGELSGGELYITLLLYSLPGLVAGFTLHEVAHAVAAVRLGDPTPRRMGRLTLDPRQHIDPLGLGALLIIGFGWAKPVQFSPFYIRHGWQRATVAGAGPLTNLALAALCAIALHIELATNADLPSGLLAFGHGGAAAILFFFLIQGFVINVILFVFNSLPIPGLDGYWVAEGLLGRQLPDVFRWMERNRSTIYVVALVLLFVIPQATQGASNPLVSLIDHVNDFLSHTFIDPNASVRGGLPSIRYLLS
jgi:Zn-dependent protease